MYLTSLKDMLIKNQTIQCLAIYFVPNYYLRQSLYNYLTTGLSDNNSLQELSGHIPLSHTNNQQLFNVI